MPLNETLGTGEKVVAVLGKPTSMYWKALYNDWAEYNSDDHKWSELPLEGFIKLIITLPAGGKMGVNGWDFYALEELDEGLKLSYWKDIISNDINGDPMEEPFLGKGGVRTFYYDGTASKVVYKDAIDIYSGIPKIDIKAGIWVDDDLAKEMGVL